MEETIFKPISDVPCIVLVIDLQHVLSLDKLNQFEIFIKIKRFTNQSQVSKEKFISIYYFRQ